MKTTLISMTLLALTIAANAADRSDDLMRSIAAAKLSNISNVKGLYGESELLPIQCLSNEKAYCIFTPEEGDGFVIVAKNDLVDPIIGYSDGSFDTNEIPDGLRWFLNAMSTQIQLAEEGKAQAPRRTAATFTPVENFITTQWSQDYPFNKSTPNNYPSGCVATAMAQCLNYCQWPTSATFEGGYYLITKTGSKTNTTSHTASVSTTYTWPYKDTYKSMGRTGDNIDELLRDCGYACYMQYSASGSGAYTFTAGEALTHIFGYPQESVKYYSYARTSDPDEWAQVIYDELAKRSPILFGGADESFGGHAFVFSGVDEDGLVWVNWGWRGAGNGFYDFTSLNPPASDGSNYSFTQGMEMLTGIRTTPLESDHIEGRIFGYSGDPYTFRFGKETDDANVEHITLYCDLPYGFINMNASDFQGVFGLFAEDLTDGTSWVIAPDLQDRDTIPAGYGYAGSSDQYKQFYFYYFVDGPQGLKSGHTYRMSFGVKDDRENRWHSIICHGGELAYDITYTGDPSTCTINPERKPVPVLTGIRSVTASSSDDFVRVYDCAGRLIYTAASAFFNLWDIPAHGILVIKQGDSVRKVVR